MAQPFRGYFGILMTPFDASGKVLWDDLQRETDWAIRAGTHGLVWPVNDSEYTTLSFPERIEGARLVAEAVGGRVPLMAGVADTSTAGAVALAEAAGQAGAASVIAMPPWHTKLGSRALIEDYYRALAAACGVPVCIQNLDAPVGSGMSSQFMVDMCRAIPLVEYVKEERDPHGVYVSEVIGLGGADVKGVFTGGTTLGLITSHRRGAAGNMAATYVPDIDAQIWNKLEAGDEAGARQIQDAWAILEKAVRATPQTVGRKEILVRRGIFSSAARRNSGPIPLDRWFIEELEHGLAAVAPYFTV